MRHLIATAMLCAAAWAALPDPAAAQQCRPFQRAAIEDAEREGAFVLRGAQAQAFMDDFNRVPPASSDHADAVLYFNFTVPPLLIIAQHRTNTITAGCMIAVPADSPLAPVVRKHFGSQT